MSDINSSESRRKLLKSIAAGTGAVVAGKSLPEIWTKPVVDSVLLPAHAQTSQVLAGFYSASGLAQLDDGLLETLIPSAHAAFPSDYCFHVNSSGSVLIQVMVAGSVYQVNATLPFNRSLTSSDGGSSRVSITGDVMGGSMVGSINVDGSTRSFSIAKSPVACNLAPSPTCTTGTFSQTITLNHTFDADVTPSNLTFNFNVADWCSPSGDGTGTLTLIADLNSSSEYIDVNVDGTNVGRLFVSGGNQCGTSGPENITIPQAVLTTAAADGTVSIDLIPGPSVDDLTSCQNKDQTLTLMYQAG